MSSLALFKPYLAQQEPGNWFLFTMELEPIPIPSWIVEQNVGTEAKEDLARVIVQIFGAGRCLGKQEGRDQAAELIRSTMKELGICLE